MTYFILYNQTIIEVSNKLSQPIMKAVDILKSDIKKVTDNNSGDRLYSNKIIVNVPNADGFEGRELYTLTFTDEKTLVINGSDELGIIYGLLYISEHFLKIHPLWYWIDQTFVKKDSIKIPVKDIESSPFEIKYRGWFINDEVCLIGWKRHLNYPPENDVWEPVFETLLRLGGNMVLPGTDLPIGVQEETAAEYGLYLTHHHAQPLDAEMFKRAYPEKQASYKKHPELYKELWKAAIERQKDKKVVWALSFRGQGDAPFWQTDPEFNTASKRGALISEVISVQYRMIKDVQPEAECSVNLYGEISELYKEGHIRLPKDVIKIWSDNGYGKMVSRRNGNEDNRISTVPENDGKEGIYYHVTFHDLQASNHLTMFPNDIDLILDEIKEVKRNKGTDYLLLNVGNIRMHTPFVYLLSKLWKQKSVDKNEFLNGFVKGVFSEHTAAIVDVIDSYSKATIKFGEHGDQRAGEQLYHYTARRLIAHQLSEKNTESSITKLHWLTGDVTSDNQLIKIRNLCRETALALDVLFDKKSTLMSKLGDEEAVRFHDLIGFQVDIMYFSNNGLLQLVNSVEHQKAGNYVQAFIFASKATWSFNEAAIALGKCEHGKWDHFYDADWLTNLSLTVENTELYRNYLRMQEDHTVYFNWYKEYIMPESEKHIYLENTHRENLSNDTLAKLLIAEFE